MSGHPCALAANRPACVLHESPWPPHLHLIHFLGLLLALQAKLIAIVLLVPGLEGGGVDLNDRVLHQRLSAHQLVVGRVVHHVHNTGLARDGLQGNRCARRGNRDESLAGRL